MIETIVKVVETSAKYAWGLFVVCVFVLFCPKQIATQIGILEIRSQYLGYWWVLLIFSVSICIGLLFSKFWQWLSAHRQKSAKRKQAKKGKQAIIARLYSLNESEQKWIAYCLLKNIRTLHATQINSAANSLLSKNIVIHGSGSMTALPFTIVDFVWEYLLIHKEDFLPINAENDPALVNNLEDYESGLRRIW